jgi:hypothetical protein
MRAGAVKFLRQLHQIQAALALKGGFAPVGFGVMFRQSATQKASDGLNPMPELFARLT